MAKSVWGCWTCTLGILSLASFFAGVDAQQLVVSVDVRPEFTSVPREGDAVTLRCEVLGFQASTQFLSWAVLSQGQGKILTWEGGIYNQVTDSSYSVVNSNTSDPLVLPEVHSLVINPANQRHNGTYLCRVIEMTSETSFGEVARAEATLIVYPADVFPSCSPAGAASVTEGSSVSCSISVRTVSFVVSASHGKPLEDWTTTMPSSGTSHLSATVFSTDDGEIFTCTSVAVDFPEVSPNCQIGPLSVTSLTTVTAAGGEGDVATGTGAPPVTPAASGDGGAVAGIFVVMVILLAIVIVLALVIYRRKRKLGRSVRYPEQPSTSLTASPVEHPPVTNGNTPPRKPIPYAMSRRLATEQPPAVYAVVQRGGRQPAPRQPTNELYASVHKEHEVTKPDNDGEVHYAAVVKERKSPEPDSEAVHYASVDKSHKSRKDRSQSTQRASTQSRAIKANGDGLVYAELDLSKPKTNETSKPVPNEEPTVYATLADMSLTSTSEL